MKSMQPTTGSIVVSYYIVISDTAFTLFTSSFHIWLLLGSFCSTAGGILSLYGSDKTNECRLGVQIAAVIVQSLAVIFTLISIIVVYLKKRNKQQKNPRAHSLFRGEIVMSYSIPKTSELVEALIILITNVACLVMIILIIVTRGGCTHFALNALYNIFSVAGSLFIACVGTFRRTNPTNTSNSVPTNKRFPKDPHPNLRPAYVKQPLA